MLSTDRSLSKFNCVYCHRDVPDPKNNPCNCRSGESGIDALFDNVFVRQDSAPEKMNGLLLPDKVKVRPARGTVVAVGQGILRQDGLFSPLSILVGDTVLFGGTDYFTTNETGEDLLIIPASRIYARVKT